MTSNFMIEGQIVKRRIFVKSRIRKTKAHNKLRFEKIYMAENIFSYLPPPPFF